MREGNYSDFSTAVHGAVSTNRLPVNGTVEVSRRCPLECSHCYNNLAMNDAAARAEELSYDELKVIFDQMADAGVLWLLLTGGEIFARRDFLDIYDYARSKGFIITLFTNGTMITERIADHLAKYPPFAIEITLYGRTRETYEKLTQVPGSYDKCMRGIALLRDRKLPLALKTVAVTVNKHEIYSMKEFAEQELGVDFKFEGMINPRIDCSSAPLAVRLTPQELVHLDLQDPQRVVEFRRFVADFADREEEHAEFVYHCGGGVSAFAIDPYGKMSICVLSHVDTWDLRQGSFDEGWSQFLRAVRERRISRPTKCNTCSIRSFCGMCAANGELENQDPEAPVEFLCQVAHLRAAAFELDVKPHGGCEYCRGGIHHERIQELAAEIRQAVDLGVELNIPESARTPAGALGCSTGGCSSCSIP